MSEEAAGIRSESGVSPGPPDALRQDELTISQAKADSLTITCPIRGETTFRALSSDDLTPTEEVRRVELIRWLIEERGVPKDHILLEPIVRRMGHAGRLRSVRADLAVTDIPAAEVRKLPVAKRVKHARFLAEVKRDGTKAKKLKTREYQVEPLLAFGPKGCMALYWDDDEHRLLWHDDEKNVQETDAAYMPRWGAAFTGASPLTYNDLEPVESLKKVFEGVADVLHQAGVGESKRMPIILQLLLAKMYDENKHMACPDQPLDIQDPKSLKVTPEVAMAQFETLLKEAVRTYNTYLPEPISGVISGHGGLKPATLVEVLSKLAGHRIHGVSGSAIQDMYMWFGDELFRRKLGAHLTPTPMTDFIVRLVAPQPGDFVKDPAVGSADFLMAVERTTDQPADGIRRLCGADVSPEGVQSAHVNVLLHGAAGSTEIKQEDSLAQLDGPFSQERDPDTGELVGRYDVTVTNPPFGKRILEKNARTLANFDLGHTWEYDANDVLQPTLQIVDAQETGVLFLEAAVRQTKPTGRVAIIVPNGYLGNRSMRYRAAREWVLRHCRVAAIVSFPRFAFKGSGADVSASVLVLERRETPLGKATDTEDYHLAVEMVERLGWQVGVKNEVPSYVRDPRDGAFKLDGNGRPVLDQDYDRVLERLSLSAAAGEFPWLAKGASPVNGEVGWSVSVKRIVDDAELCMDPKRLCEKYSAVRESIMAVPHFKLADVVRVQPQLSGPAVGELSASRTYKYVEIQDVGPGIYSTTDLRGWELPSRARHLLDPGDLLVGGIWGSVVKWFLAGHEENLIATNGFHRLKVVDSDLLLDLVVGLCTESYAVQGRALSRGSDGLAELVEDDLLQTVLPRIADPQLRKDVQPYIDALLAGHTSTRSAVSDLIAQGRLPVNDVPTRGSHVHLV